MNVFFGNVIAITQQALWGRALDHAVSPVPPLLASCRRRRTNLASARRKLHACLLHAKRFTLAIVCMQLHSSFSFCIMLIDSFVCLFVYSFFPSSYQNRKLVYHLKKPK